MNSLISPAVAPLSKRQKELLGRRLEVERRDTEFSMELLSHDVDAVRHSRHDSPTDDEHDPEGPTLAFEQSQSNALLVQAKVRLDQIDAAIERIHLDNYGRCASCGGAISYARLGARPYATHCIRCAERTGS
jgi:RNA polymerase-binding transcription factor DksA